MTAGSQRFEALLRQEKSTTRVTSACAAQAQAAAPRWIETPASTTAAEASRRSVPQRPPACTTPRTSLEVTLTVSSATDNPDVTAPRNRKQCLRASGVWLAPMVATVELPAHPEISESSRVGSQTSVLPHLGSAAGFGLGVLVTLVCHRPTWRHDPKEIQHPASAVPHRLRRCGRSTTRRRCRRTGAEQSCRQPSKIPPRSTGSQRCSGWSKIRRLAGMLCHRWSLRWVTHAHTRATQTAVAVLIAV